MVFRSSLLSYVWSLRCVWLILFPDPWGDPGGLGGVALQMDWCATACHFSSLFFFSCSRRLWSHFPSLLGSFFGYQMRDRDDRQRPGSRESAGGFSAGGGSDSTSRDGSMKLGASATGSDVGRPPSQVRCFESRFAHTFASRFGVTLGAKRLPQESRGARSAASWASE